MGCFVFFNSNTHCACSGSGGNRFGFHCIYRSHHQDAWCSSLVCPLFHHASLLGALNPDWKHRRSGGPPERPENVSSKMASGSTNWYCFGIKNSSHVSFATTDEVIAPYVSGTTCAVAFVISLLFAQHSGIYWVTLFDNFAGSVPLLTTGLFEMMAIVYIYGIDRLVYKTYAQPTYAKWPY